MSIQEKAQSVSRVRWHRTPPHFLVPRNFSILRTAHGSHLVAYNSYEKSKFSAVGLVSDGGSLASSQVLLASKLPPFMNLPQDMRNNIRVYLTSEDQLAFVLCLSCLFPCVHSKFGSSAFRDVSTGCALLQSN
jgi:hypothetical protein